MVAILAKWSPVFERSILSTVTFAGTCILLQLWEVDFVCLLYIGAYIGNVFSLPLSGLLCQYGFSGGWPSVFYVFGKIMHYRACTLTG